MDYSVLQGSVPYLLSYLSRNRKELSENEKFFRVKEVIVIFVVHLNLRRLKSRGKIIYLMCGNWPG